MAKDEKPLEDLNAMAGNVNRRRVPTPIGTLSY
jgi:hypothetical protein